MTVRVTLPDGAEDEFLRYRDSYVERADGTLVVIRRGNKHPRRYGSGEWVGVHGDRNHWWNRHF